jgi:hypothetical protein
MKEIQELIKSVRCIIGIETGMVTMSHLPHIKLTLSKALIKEGDLDKIYNLLDNQIEYGWTVDITP